MVTLVAPTARDLNQVQEWCHNMWPHTSGHMASRIWVARVLFDRFDYTCTWIFQFREDLTMFLLTWAYLVDSHE